MTLFGAVLKELDYVVTRALNFWAPCCIVMVYLRVHLRESAIMRENIMENYIWMLILLLQSH